MIDQQSANPTAALLRKLRWLVRLRWVAGMAMIGGAAGIGLLGTWSTQYTAALTLGVAILIYNLPIWAILRRWGDGPYHVRALAGLAWLQVGLDLVCLTLAVLWTGGGESPLRPFFVLHMVLSSLLMSPRQSYLAAIIAIVLVSVGLWLTGQWPSGQEVVLLVGWAAVLVLTVFLMTRVVADIRRQDVELFDQAQRIRAILQTAADGIITIDDRGIILSTNPAADATFGYKAGELLGKNVKMLMPEPYRSEHDGYVSNFLRTRQAKIIGIGREVVGLRSDGSTFPLDLAVSAVSLNGRELFTGIVRDITERKQAENELRELTIKLQRHQQALIQAEKMAAMGQMAAGVVHEISNPLASMDTLLQLVQRQPDRMNAQAIEDLRQQVKRIVLITRQLTDFAHPNETPAENHPANDVVQGALDMVRFDHRIRRVEVVRDFSPNAGCVRVTLHAVQQVIVNMVFNALDAMCQVASPRLTVRTERAGDWAIIEISDNGEGIAPEHLHRIFEPFFTTKPLGHGTGLGLSISYSIIQQHGGHCEVSSRLGEGTTFRISLPVAQS